MIVVTVSNTNLFAVAAATLGDATQWVRIAQLNGLSDSIVAGTLTLALPPADPSATGGIVTLGTPASGGVTPVDIFAPHASATAARKPQVAAWDGFTWDDGSVWG